MLCPFAMAGPRSAVDHGPTNAHLEQSGACQLCSTLHIRFAVGVPPSCHLDEDFITQMSHRLSCSPRIYTAQGTDHTSRQHDLARRRQRASAPDGGQAAIWTSISKTGELAAGTAICGGDIRKSRAVDRIRSLLPQ